MSAVSFESRDLPKERQECLGEASLARGGRDVEYFENYSFLVVSRGSREPGCARSAQPEEGGLKAGQGFWGVGGRGVRGFFAPAALSACGTRGILASQPRAPGRWRDFWRPRCLYFGCCVTVLALSGSSPPFPKFNFIFPPWCKLCKKAAMGLGYSGFQASDSQGPSFGRRN